METKSGVNPALTIAPLTSSTDALAMNAGSCGFSQGPHQEFRCLIVHYILPRLDIEVRWLANFCSCSV
jgi:hypothetical protein